MDLGRAQRVEMEVRALGLHPPEKVFVPLNSKIGVMPALEENLLAPRRVKPVEFFTDFILRADIALGVIPRRAVERAERAIHITHIRVIDVAVDAVGDDPLGMLSGANLVRRRTKGRQILAI